VPMANAGPASIFTCIAFPPNEPSASIAPGLPTA
jgi:hypothetical protein